MDEFLREKKRLANKEWRLLNKDRAREYDRNRSKSKDEYKKINEPHKLAARRKYNNAWRRGLIERKWECVECGSDDRVVGHHRDYSKPLEVNYLCHQCHVLVHTPTALPFGLDYIQKKYGVIQ